MRVTIIIDCDNAAFGDEPEIEVQRIMRTAHDRLNTVDLADLGTFTLFDVNGNVVGKLVVEHDNGDAEIRYPG